MRWQGRKGSSNIDDRRRKRSRNVRTGAGAGSILLIILAIIFGRPDLIQQFQGSNTSTGVTQTTDAQDDELAQFVSVVLQDTEDVWNKLFREQLNQDYQEPILVLYSGRDQSACGSADAASGPFYCPADRKIYIDLSFYQDLKNRFQAPGDFAMAYVVAHEVAHHIQNLLGISRQVQSQRNRISKTEYNKLKVRLELQADFLAGVWAHHAQKMKNILEPGDIEEALNAANAIGDDRLQMQAQGYVVPDAFTHGTSEQRVRWFKKGFETGDVNQGDTFSATSL